MKPDEKMKLKIWSHFFQISNNFRTYLSRETSLEIFSYTLPETLYVLTELDELHMIASKMSLVFGYNVNFLITGRRQRTFTGLTRNSRLQISTW